MCKTIELLPTVSWLSEEINPFMREAKNWSQVKK
jgi:hypothetical protein